MNQELQLKLQAYLDGELSEMEGRQVIELVASDGDAKSLLTELTMTRDFLRGHDSQLAVPETREFYWSKIARAIERSEAAPAATSSRPPLWLAWRRYFVPVAGGAFVLFLTVAGLNYYDYSPFDLATSHLSKVENQSEHTSSFSFRSHAENMTVVWIYDKSDDASAPTLDDDKDEVSVQ